MTSKCIVFVTWTLFFSINARPEPPYYYPTPTLRNAPTPSSQTFGLSASQSIGSQTASLAQNYNAANNIATNFNAAQESYIPPRTSYGTPILRNANNAGVSVASSSASSGIQQAYNGASLPSRSYGSPDLISSNQVLTPSNTYIPQEGPINIQKHIYVHAAPEDEEEPRQRVQQQQVPGQKHYKIIFIKTPTYTPTAQYIAQQQARQKEKTLIYVLVKKPEEAAEIVAPQVAPAPINKPEVYFIKYKGKSEASNQILQQGENIQDNDSVVIESAAGRGTSQGYNYDRPAKILK